MTRESNNSKPDKSGESSLKPVTAEFSDGRKIDAAHHIITDSGVVHFYVKDRVDGIDITASLMNDLVMARSDVGREALGISGAEEQEQRLVTDGGLDVECTCGADLIDTAELGTDFAPKPGARLPRPAMNTIPAATCVECGEDVGAFGMEVVIAVWNAHGEPHPGSDHDPVNGGDE